MTRPEDRPTIRTAHGSALEERARQRLKSLLDRRDLAPWFAARILKIDEEERIYRCVRQPDGASLIRWRAFSDEQLQHLGSRLDDLLLSLYLHEQLHAHLGAQPGLGAALRVGTNVVPTGTGPGRRRGAE